MKRILYIISTLKRTGPVNVLYNTVKNLDRTKYEPVILTLSKEPDNSLKQEIQALNIECQCLNLKGKKGYVEAIKIIQVVDKIKPDIVHAHSFRATLFTALFLSKYKTIATIHCDYDVDYVMAYGKFIGSIMSFLMDFSLKRINICIAVSELLCNMLKKKKKYELSFVNNGIDTEIFKPAENKTELRNKLHLPLNKKIWIWAGVMRERKNPLLLVDIIKNLNTDDIFIFCGDGSLLSELKAQINGLKNVILTGNINNINEYLQASDYYISTSLSEGLPISVLEAMACGLPVILSDIPQHLILFKKKIGFTYKVNNSDALCGAIKKITTEDFVDLSNNSINTVEQYFSSITMTKEYEEYYDKNINI